MRDAEDLLRDLVLALDADRRFTQGATIYLSADTEAALDAALAVVSDPERMPDAKLTAEGFVTEAVARLSAFIQEVPAARRMMPEAFPERRTFGEWLEAFSVWAEGAGG